jgi:hypothetical protein
MEDDPVAKLTFSDGEQDMTRHNSALFMHIGSLAMYDHIFVTTEGERKWAYIFRHSEAFPILRNFMAKNHFTMHLNLAQVADVDRQAFEQSLAQQNTDLDHVPDEWL